ncbi:TIGR04222 domain-containing membrane protein [Streptomyces sp. NPDC005931]|uniref:TIGR04222 domain-containing membrane protein n=1 Tax=Streptomyces sp. NPDC005931 TaxID=3364737 RepID=UPI0036925CF6
MGGSAPTRRTPHEIALLRGGPRAAVTVAVVALQLRGAVEAGAPGTVRAVPMDAVQEERTLPPLPPAGVPLDSWTQWSAVRGEAAGNEARALVLERTVYRCLGEEPLALRELVRHPDVRWALAELRVGLADAGLLRLPLLRPNRAAGREVRALRDRHPLPTGRRGLTDHAKLAVALHGTPALRALVPLFALRTGLVPRVRITHGLRHRFRGGTYGGGGYSASRGGGGCGGGSY